MKAGQLLSVGVANRRARSRFLTQSFIRIGGAAFFLGAVDARATSAGSWFGATPARATSAGRGRGNGGDDVARR